MEKIENLKEKIRQLPGQSIMTNSQISYTWNKPYKEPTNYRIKSCKAMDDFELQRQIDQELNEAEANDNTTCS